MVSGLVALAWLPINMVFPWLCQHHPCSRSRPCVFPAKTTRWVHKAKVLFDIRQQCQLLSEMTLSIFDVLALWCLSQRVTWKLPKMDLCATSCIVFKCRDDLPSGKFRQGFESWICYQSIRWSKPLGLIKLALFFSLGLILSCFCWAVAVSFPLN